MREYIGLLASVAVAKATECGLNVVRNMCDSDKQKAWDSEIVVQAKLDGNNLNLVSSKFLMIKE